MEYLDLNGIRKAFGSHLIKFRKYTDEEATEAVTDFPNPYTNCYLSEKYIEIVEIDGVEYEKNACIADLSMFSGKTPKFKFYLYYRLEDIPTKKVQEYLDARKLYQIDELDKKDFR